MSITAAQLSKTGARGKELDSIVREHLRIIDERLLKADRRWGRNVVLYDLPVTFPVPGLDKKSAQRIVYSAILRSLDSRKFEARVLLETDKTTLYIAWMTDLDVAEVEAMSSLIRARRIFSKDVEVFVQKGSIAAPRAASGLSSGQARPAPPMHLGETQIMKPRGGVARAASRTNQERGDSREALSGQARGAEVVRGRPSPPAQAELELLGEAGRAH